eukprot:TRINITY_DN66743_c0_g1_i1.p1 TRINITY_DN66743_c0_g1~~TRINITY_DN66743_c0_g1_i1.p1  ORF type:complete len:1198 (+),score=309.53 TRINITY_DN66743_c0_g1_i1:131-3724(+)
MERSAAREPAVQKLLRENNDDYNFDWEARLDYGKQIRGGKGLKKKPCVLGITPLAVYVLKGDSYELVRHVLHADAQLGIAPSSAAGSLSSPRGTAAGETLAIYGGGAEPLLVYGPAEQLAEAARRHQSMKAALRVAAPAPGAAAAAAGEGYGAAVAAPAMLARSAARRQADSGAQAADVDEDTAARDAGPRRFLVQNIISADFIDYSAIRSAYNARPPSEPGKEAQGQETEISALLRNLRRFSKEKGKEVEKYCSEHADKFGRDLGGTDKGEFSGTAEQQQLLHLPHVVAARRGAEQLRAAGHAAMRARTCAANVASALDLVRRCHSCAALFSRAEKLAAARKHYPALLQLEALEAQMRPLARHAYVAEYLSGAVPQLRSKIYQDVKEELTEWLSEVRKHEIVFGRQAVKWAEERIEQEPGNGRRPLRHVVLDANDEAEFGPDDQQDAAPMQPRPGGLLHQRRGSHEDGDDEADEEDWADDLLWDLDAEEADEGCGRRRGPGRRGEDQRNDDAGEHRADDDPTGPAQFLDKLTDSLMDPSDPDHEADGHREDDPLGIGGRTDRVTLRVVQNCQQVHEVLGRARVEGIDGGAMHVRKYYVDMRSRQLELLLDPSKQLEDVRRDDCELLAKLAGFFLVESVVRRSTSPPLCDDSVLHRWWEKASERMVGWMREAAVLPPEKRAKDWFQDRPCWDDIKAFADRNRQTLLAVEQVWNVGSGSGTGALRLGHLFDTLEHLKTTALVLLRDTAEVEIDFLSAQHAHVMVGFEATLDLEQVRPEDLSSAVAHLAEVSPDVVRRVRFFQPSFAEEGGAFSGIAFQEPPPPSAVHCAECVIMAEQPRLSAMLKHLNKKKDPQGRLLLTFRGVMGEVRCKIGGGERYELIETQQDLNDAVDLLITRSPSCGSDPLPRCTTSVLRAVTTIEYMMLDAFELALADGDEKIMSKVESLLRHLARKIELDTERMRSAAAHTNNVATLSVNAAALNAAALYLGHLFAEYAASVHISREGRLLPFSDARRRLAKTQRTAQKCACAMARDQVQSYVQLQLTADAYAEMYDSAHTPLSDLHHYLSSRWKDRRDRLPAVLAARLQRAELAVVDDRLCQVAKDIAFAAPDHHLHGGRAKALKRLKDDAEQLERVSDAPTKDGTALVKLKGCIDQMIDESAQLDQQPAPEAAGAALAGAESDASPARGRFGGWGWGRK